MKKWINNSNNKFNKQKMKIINKLAQLKIFLKIIIIMIN